VKFDAEAAESKLEALRAAQLSLGAQKMAAPTESIEVQKRPEIKALWQEFLVLVEAGNATVTASAASVTAYKDTGCGGSERLRRPSLSHFVSDILTGLNGEASLATATDGFVSQGVRVSALAKRKGWDEDCI
jgi:hypothetical protein